MRRDRFRLVQRCGELRILTKLASRSANRPKAFVLGMGGTDGKRQNGRRFQNAGPFQAKTWAAIGRTGSNDRRPASGEITQRAQGGRPLPVLRQVVTGAPPGAPLPSMSRPSATRRRWPFKPVSCRHLGASVGHYSEGRRVPRGRGVTSLRNRQVGGASAGWRRTGDTPTESGAPT